MVLRRGGVRHRVRYSDALSGSLRSEAYKNCPKTAKAYVSA